MIGVSMRLKADIIPELRRADSGRTGARWKSRGICVEVME